MFHSKLLLIIVVIFYGCVVIPTSKDRTSLKTIRQDEAGVQVNRILMIGTGPVASRVFLDNLSSELMQSLKVMNVHAEFVYMGKAPSSVSLKIDSLVTPRFDTYLVFKPSAHAYLSMTSLKYIGVGPGVMASGYGNQYTDTFAVALYTRKENLQLVWQGDLMVDFDLANDSKYKKISKLILDEFLKRRILQD
jgi:hypothetical protein